MKIKNLHIYNDNQERLKTLQEEYTMLGFDTDLAAGHLTVYTIVRKKEKKVEEKKRR